MKGKLLTLLCTLLLLFQTLSAQERTLTGKVTDEKNAPLPGVNVMVKGYSRGCISNSDGNYTINVRQNDIIIFSFVGYESQEFIIADQTELNVTLAPALTDLDEIVVIGYGSQKRSHFSGASAGISAEKEKLNEIPVSRLEHALQGKLAGVQIRDKSSQVGEAPDVKIRGSSSFNASNNPLIVIDGFPLIEGSLSDVDMNDVQSLEVLKDAASTAIYGSRGANGVIMITTKKGVVDRTQFDIKVSTGFSHVYKYFDAYDGIGLAEYYFNQERQKWETPFLELGQAVPENPGPDVENPEGDTYPQWDEWYSAEGKGDFYFQHNILTGQSGVTEWQHGVTRMGWNRRVALSANGGNKKIQYYLGGSYGDDKGVLVDNEYNTFSFTSNLDIKLTDKIKIGINLRPQYQKRRNSHASMANTIKQIGYPLYHDAFSLQLGLGPTIGWKGIGDFTQASDFKNMIATDANGDQIFDEDGNPIYIKSEFNTAAISPLSEIMTDHDWSTFFKMTGNVYLNIEIADGLNFKTSAGTYMRYSVRERYIESYNVSKGNNNSGNGTGYQLNAMSYSLVNENTLNYNKHFGRHDIELLAGFSIENYVDNFSRVEGNLFPNDFVRSMSAAGEISKEGTYSGKSDEGLMSGFARVLYNYNEKYLVSAVMRADGSSQFGPDKRVGYFPSLSAGWRISEEGFLQSADWLSTLKLRATWGISGNNRIGRYAYVTPVNMRQYQFGTDVLSGFAPVPLDLNENRVLGNPNLGWEQTNETNVGLDFGLFRNRITFTVDGYTNLTKSLLLQDPVVTITGFDSQWANIGQIRNQGIEMMLNSVNIVKNKFSWNMGITFTKNRNYLVSYGDVDEQFFTGYKHQYVLRVNEPVCQYYGYVTDGIWKSEKALSEAQAAGLAQSSDVLGGVKIVDYNKDGQVNSDDQTTIGNPYPDFDWGFQNRFTYQNFDLSVNFQGSHGFDVMQQSFWYGQKLGKWYLDDLYVDEFHGSKPIKTGSIIESDYYVEDGSYLALRDFILGYNMAGWKGTRNLRIYLSAHNLLYWWYRNYNGINPEYVEPDPVVGVSGNILFGEQLHTNPLARTIQVGIDISF
jgi:TonB-linked SusC/RagA family outer membrane protein